MSAFDDLALAYDRSIDWERRLGREMEFIRNHMELSRELRVLDMACGTGRHAIEIASMGIEVVAFDHSKSMIEEAKRLAEKKDVRIEFHIADMLNFRSVIGGDFDLVLCLGNSLALLASTDEVEKVASSVSRVIKKGGFFLFQVLNFEEIEASRFRYFPIKGGTTETGHHVIFSRFFLPSMVEEKETLVACSFTRENRGWSSVIQTQEVLKFAIDVIELIISNAGFSHLEVFSDYSRNKINRTLSRSIVGSAKK
ncbi:MAG: class I SAM-dependent methyltransferase [Candidatus Hodarchaeota archaeon]